VVVIGGPLALSSGYLGAMTPIEKPDRGSLPAMKMLNTAVIRCGRFR